MKAFFLCLKKFGKRVAEFQILVILTVAYFIFLLPYALVQCLVRHPRRRQAATSYWISTPPPTVSLDIAALRRQF